MGLLIVMMLREALGMPSELHLIVPDPPLSQIQEDSTSVTSSRPAASHPGTCSAGSTPNTVLEHISKFQSAVFLPGGKALYLVLLIHISFIV